MCQSKTWSPPKMRQHPFDGFETNSYRSRSKYDSLSILAHMGPAVEADKLRKLLRTNGIEVDDRDRSWPGKPRSAPEKGGEPGQDVTT